MMFEGIKPLQDRAAIRDVLERYCRGIDRLDAEMVNGVYWDEAVDDHGVYKGPGKEFAAFVMPILRSHLRSTMHTLGQSLIELSGNRATSETYFVSYHSGQENGQEFLETSGGRYVDIFEQRGEEWRILDRVIVVEWTKLDRNVQETSVPRDRFRLGSRDKNDICYGVK